MNIIKQSLLTPVAIITVYNGIESYYAEIMKVTSRNFTSKKTGEKGSKDFLTAPKPLSSESIRKFFNLTKTVNDFNPNFFKNRFIDEKFLACEKTVAKKIIVWYEPAMIREVITSDVKDVKTGKYMMPGIIYVVVNNELMVYAFENKSRPKPDEVLYKYPTGNFHSTAVCLGNVEKVHGNNEFIETESRLWQGYYWNSAFTSIENPAFYKDRKDTKKPYDKKLLKKVGDLRTILKSL